MTDLDPDALREVYDAQLRAYIPEGRFGERTGPRRAYGCVR